MPVADRPVPRAMPLPLLLLALLVTALVVPLIAADGSRAAGYTVWSCRGPDGAPVGTAAWTPGGTAGTHADDCAAGGALHAELAQADGNGTDVGGLRFALPAGATIDRYRVWMALAVSPTSDGSAYAAGLSEADGLGVQGFREGCLAVPAGCAWGSTADPLDAGNLTEASGTFPGLAVAVRCATSTGCAPTTDPAASVAVYRSAVEIRDAAAPTVGPLGGSLVEPGAETTPGRHTVLVPLADPGGGVARTELLVDGVVAQTTPTGGDCAEPYAVAAPCATRTDRAFVVDTTALAAGPHAVAVRAVDAAGNVTDGAPVPFTVTPAPAGSPLLPPGIPPVVPPGPGVPTPPAATPRALSLRIASRVSLPERGRTRGTARRADGTPAAGVRLDVLAGPVGASARELRWLTRVRTSASGRFVLPRSRESRTLRVVPADAADVATPADVVLVAPLRATLRGPAGAVRNGRSATLRGTIAGAGDAAGDLRVLVQAIVDGRWSTVDAVTPAEDGTVRWTYRFRRTVQRSAYRFRLLVPATRALPWPRTASARRVVRVTPGGARR